MPADTVYPASTARRHGSVVIMLHSHLPFYRKAGMWPFGEENLYECMAETYLPLLNALNDLCAEGIRPNLTVGITPILAEQLADTYLQEGFIAYINTRLKAANDDVASYELNSAQDALHLRCLARYYQQFFTQTLADFEGRYQRNLLAGFKALQDAGAIEITTSSATHGFSPLLSQPASVNGQFRVGVEAYRRHFGRDPKGCWLPECAYRPAWVGDAGQWMPATDAYLAENGLGYFFTEYTAIEGSTPTDARRLVSRYGNLSHVPMTAFSPTGLTTYEPYWLKEYPVAVMGRNHRASFQVWSAADGYPGDGLYREFHRKDEVSGLHYWALTSKTTNLGQKALYSPEAAFGQVAGHAAHFVALCEQLLASYHAEAGEPGLLMVSFDTELYGHWWFEGVAWLKAVLKGLACSPSVQPQTASQYLELFPPKHAIQLPESTWGEGGHYWVWDNPDTHWVWPLIHKAERRMVDLVQSVSKAKETDLLTERCLNQAFRELLLLQASDWPFLITTGQAKDYAVERFEGHLANFNVLAAMVETAEVDDTVLEGLEATNNPFPAIDYRWLTAPTVPLSQPQTA